MSHNNISEVIKELLFQNKEGDYWDFKQEYTNNYDMLHDIICMANQTSHKGDRYIIYGIAESNGSFTIQGLTTEKKQADVLDYLRCQKFAICAPDINLFSVDYGDKKINVIIIKDKPLKPYYLLEEIQEKNKAILRAGAIYTRTGDTNTPKNKTADIYQVEQMWRERFGIDMSALERFSHLIRETENWENVITQDETLYYHKHFPEFKIKIQYKQECYGTPYTVSHMNGNALRDIASLYFHTTLLKDIGIYSSDWGRTHIIDPECQYLDEHLLKISTIPENPSFHYFLKDSMSYSLLKILSFIDQKGWSNPNPIGNQEILLFENKQHLKKFTVHLIEKLDDNVQYTPKKVSTNQYKNQQPNADFHQRCYAIWEKWRYEYYYFA